MTLKKIKLIKDIHTLRKQIKNWRMQGLTIGLIPTMGALHKGHLSLVKTIKPKVDRTLATIFINPKQFGVGEDLERYPREEALDCEKLEGVGVDAVYMPQMQDIYPVGFTTNIHVSGISDELCGKFRPGHFDGVATIVTKLFMQTTPDVAIFGEKDFQQLAMIKRLQSDLDMPIDIISGAIIREDDGLALSSRNVYLNKAERAIAPLLSKTLQDAISRAKQGQSLRAIEEQAVTTLLKAGFSKVDYFSFCHAKTLKEVDSLDQPTQVLAAVHLGGTRLIDNFKVCA